MEPTTRMTPAGGATGLRRAATTVGAALVLAAAGAAPGGPGVTGAAAQEAEVACRCVDAAGEVIEDCRCLRTPELSRALTFSRVHAPRARIGVSVRPDQGGEDDRRGARLVAVRDGSPADEAGLREGDVVIRVDGRSVLDPLEDTEDEERLDEDASLPVQRFIALVGELEPGEEAEIEYVREGETRRAVVTPEGAGWSVLRSGEGPEVRLFSHGPGATDFFVEPEGGLRRWTADEGGRGFRMRVRSSDPCFTSESRGRLVWVGGDRCVDGLHLQALNPQLAEYFGVEEGVLVTELEDEAALGLRAGDVIVAIGERAVEEASDVQRILGSYEEDEPVTLTVVRRGEEIRVRGTRR